MSKAFEIRCSSLPRFMKCPSSEKKWKFPVHETDTEPQNNGIAAHDLLSLHVGGIPVDDDGIKIVCDRQHADRDEVAPLFWYGANAWNELKQYFDRVGAEEQFSTTMLLKVGGKRTTVTLTGRPDLGGSDVTLDWKTGRVWSDADWQLQGYNYAKRRKYGIVVWLRERSYTVIEAMPRDAFEDALAKQITLIGKEYSPGSHCHFCPGRDECEARTNHAQTAMAVITGQAEMMTAERMAEIYPTVSMLEDAIATYKAMVRERIILGGPMALPNGTEVYLSEFSKDVIDPRKAWPLLTEELSDEELAGCMRVGVTAIKDAIRAKIRAEFDGKPPKGALGEAVKVLWESLQEAGAIDQTPQSQTRVRKQKNG